MWPRPRSAEVGQDHLHAVEGRLEIDAHHRVHVLVGQLRDETRDAATGVVDPHVHGAEALEGGVEDALHVLATRHVGDDRERLGARARSHLPELVLAPRGQDDPRVTSADERGERRADARARSRDHDDSVLHGA